jgi:CCR4-NOT transcriptional regulation complex NOT5 subunit
MSLFILQIKDIKDDVEYYIENCQEPDFMENDMVYDDIDGLEEMLLEVNVSFIENQVR